MSIDRLDRRILAQLQSNCDISVADLANQIDLSTNACWRRIKRLEEDGFIRRRVALLDEQKLGLNVTVFVQVKTNEHNERWLRQFAEGVRAVPEVIEFYRLSGDVDYLLKIMVADINDYDRVYKKLISIAPMHDVASSFAMERIKSSTELPLSHL
jgi:Lrp/AsnC family transcriptional regulator